ncbi:MAG: polyprenyl synthetase family protein [Bacteroidales bacterium]|nr:polyprenyl synthetase family protein [Bacteroidales bacterium]
MTTIESIQQSIADELQQLNDHIRQALVSPNALMNQVVDNYLRAKGKQIRPILVILSARLYGPVTPKVIAAAAAVELLHNASLIHDDVVDESKMRRGLPTINKVWDNHIAVLVGDFFVSTALQLAISTGDPRIIASLASLGKLLSLGEIDQIYNARQHCRDEEAYFNVIDRKTASLFISCVEMGAYAAGAKEGTFEPLRAFAKLLGECFQIKDDIFDYLGDAKEIGKPTGNDLREGKITLPLLWALNNPDAPNAAQMNELSKQEELSAQEIDRLIQFARTSGGIDYAYDTIDRLREEATDYLHNIGGSPDTRDQLAAIFDYIIARDH